GTLSGAFGFTTATGTSVTSTNAFFTTLATTNFSPSNINTTNLTSTNANLTSITFGTAVGTSVTTTNLNVSGVLSLPSNSITDAMVVDTITASNYLPLAGGTLTGPLYFTSASGTAATSTNAIFVNATSTNLYVSGALNLPSNSVTDAMIPDTITASNYLLLTGGTLSGAFGFTTATGTSVTSTNGFFTTLASTNDTVTNLTATNATTTNLNVSGALTLPSNSVTDAMVVDTITASNYLLLTGGTLSGAFGFTTATGTSVTSTNAFFTTLATTNFSPSNINTTNLTSTNANLTSITFTTAVGTSVTTTNLNVSSGLSLPANSITDAMVVDTITASNYLPLAGGTLTGSLYFTSASGTAVTSTNLLATNATSTNLYISGTVNLPANSITDAMVVAGLTIDSGTINNTPIGVSGASTAIFTNVTSSNATSTNLYISGTTNLGNTTISNLTATNATSTNLYVSGALNLPSNSVTDAMVVDTITASNYLPLAGGTLTGPLYFTSASGTLSGAFGFTTATGTSVTSTNAFFTTLATTNFSPSNISTTNLTSTNANLTSITFTTAVGTSVTTTNLNVSGVLSLPSNSVTDAMVVDTITASNYLLLTGGTLSGAFGFTTATGTSVTSTNGFFTTLAATTLNPTNVTATSVTTTNLNVSSALTLPSNSVTDAMVVDTITASNYLPLAGGTLTGSLFFTSASGTAVTSTSAIFVNATSTNLYVSGVLSLPSNSVTDAMVVDTITASNYLLLTGGTLSGAFGFTTATGTSVTSTNAFFTTLATTNFSPSNISTTNLTSTNANLTSITFTTAVGTSVTTTNLNVSGALTLPSNSVTDAMVVDTITASNYLLLTGGTLSGAFGFTTATGTSVTSTNAFFTTLKVDSCTGCGGGSSGTTTWTFSGLNVFLVTSTSKVGIGTSVPSTTLHIVSTTEQFRIGYNSSNYVSFTVASNGGLTISPSGSATTTIPNLVSTSVTSTNLYISSTSTLTKLVVQGGNVGIGTSTPKEKLAVVGNISNILDPSGPMSEISATTIGSTPTSISVVGRYAYAVAQGDENLYIMDVSNPSKPVQVGTAALGTQPFAIYVAGRYAYITLFGAAAVVTIDISNPVAARKIATTTVGANPRSIFVSGKYAYVANRTDNNISVLDISNPLAPTQIATTDVGGNPFSIHGAGRYVYTANNAEATISVVDVSNPYVPVQVSTAAVGVAPSGIYVSGKFAYVTNFNDNTISIVDISNPASMVQVATTSVGVNPNGIFVSGRYAYVANETSSTVSIVDVSSSTKPVLIKNVAAGSGSSAVYVSGRYAYTGNTNVSSMSVLDISGTEVTSLIAHSAEVGNIQSLNDIIANGNIIAQTSLAVGPGGIKSDGALSIFASSTGATSSVFSIVSPASSTILRVMANGKIGIGTSIVTSTLDVQGTLEVNLVSTTAATAALCHVNNGATDNQVISDCTGTPAADYMEMYPADVGLEKGDVVVFSNNLVTTSDGNRVTKLSKSTSTYQSGLAGVISDSSQAGDFNSIGHNVASEDNPLPLALSGRVLIKVTNVNGDIHVGDKLTSSNISGTAMKATQEGPTIGIAMGDYTSASVGTIMSLVNVGWNNALYNSLVINTASSSIVLSTGIGTTTVSIGTNSTAGGIQIGSAGVSTTIMGGLSIVGIGVTTTNFYASGITNLGTLTFVSATGTNFNATSLNISASSTFRTSTITGGFFQTDFTDCSAESQTVNYNATTGKFTCLADAGGTAGSAFTTPVTVTDGSTTSSLRADGLFIATSTSNLQGLFFVNSVGSVSASGSLQVFGNTALTTTTITTTTITNANITNLVVTNCTGCGAAGASTSTFDIFVSSTAGTGTWTAPAGIDYAQVIVTAGGGGGGEASDCSDTACEAAAGGGGAGGTSIEMFTAAELGSAQSIIVGSGGSGGASDAGASGASGGTSTFGSPNLVGANPGMGGSGALSSGAVHVIGAGGAGGAATTSGDINLNGGSGGSGVAPTEGALGGTGGASYWGGGGSGGAAATTNGEAGVAGTAYGSGGGGGAQEDASVTTGHDGGNGAGGVIVVISYNSSGGDLAEWYEAKEDVLPGDLVSISSSSLEYESYQLGLSKTSILEKATPGSSVVGVVSTIPFDVMGGDLLGASRNAKPIALAGRVPVNVSNENGPVKAGDMLTISSVPGIAMRATKSGVTIGRSLQDAECVSSSLCKVMVLVNTSYFNGIAMKKVMAEQGLDLDTIPAGFDIGRAMLTKMIADKQNITASTSISEVYTDRIMAGLEIVTPRIVTQDLTVDNIKTFSGVGLGLALNNGELFSIFAAATNTASSTEGSTSSTPVITFDNLGNGFFAGKLTANEISANQIFGLNIITDKLSSLSDVVSEMNSASSTTSTLIVEGLETNVLEVEGIAAFLNGLRVAGLATFNGDVVVEGNVRLAKLFVTDIENPLINSITSSLQTLAQELNNTTTTLNSLAAQLAENTILLNTLFASTTSASSSVTFDLNTFAQSSGLQFENAVSFRGGLQVDSIAAISGVTSLMNVLLPLPLPPKIWKHAFLPKIFAILSPKRV
ncbi:MAG: hypothetical protein HYT15_00005, partial [Candidatus Magasanikbacteria bacterium]|nr:hypothetical protein [Candidatus Magasanikbacteria bacterium]